MTSATGPRPDFGEEIDALLTEPRRDLLAFTDKYPPDSVGGAEISLHLVLSQPPFHDRVVVALFDARAASPHLYRQNGVPVIVLPDAAPWPLHRRPDADRQRARAAGRGALAAFELLEGARFLCLGGAFRDAADRASALVFELGRKPRGGIASDFSLGSASSWHRARLAVGLAARMRPRATLLDNCRSILLAPALRGAAPRTRIVAMVRDNRFHCARYDQSVAVDGAPCAACGFACAARDAGANALRRLAHARHLRKSAARRRAALEAADVVTVTSRYLETAISAVVAGDRLRRIPNPAGDVEAAAAAIRGVAEGPGLHVVIAGMLNEAKGQLAFLEAAQSWLRADPSRHVHLAGRGDRMAARIRDFAARTDLANQITLHGFLARDELLRLMRECQAVAAPTVWPEPFGRIPLEAALARRPIVAFAQGGLAESIRDGVTGFLVPPEDYPTFLDRLDRLDADPALRHAMGVAALAHVSAAFAPDRATTPLVEALGLA